MASEGGNCREELPVPTAAADRPRCPAPHVFSGSSCLCLPLTALKQDERGLGFFILPQWWPCCFSPTNPPPSLCPLSQQQKHPACPWAEGIQSPRKGDFISFLGALGGWKGLKRGVLYAFCRLLSHCPSGVANSPPLDRSACLSWWVLFFSPPTVDFRELGGGCSKTSFQMHHKIWRGRPMASASRWGTIGCFSSSSAGWYAFGEVSKNSVTTCRPAAEGHSPVPPYSMA